MIEQTWAITLRRQMMECDSWVTFKQNFHTERTVESVRSWAEMFVCKMFPGWGIVCVVPIYVRIC